MFLRLINYLGELTILFCQVVYWAFIPPFKPNRILVQAKRVGPESFFIAALVAFFIGMIMALQMAAQMLRLNAELYIPGVVAVSLTRELAPVLTSLIVAGRLGAGITAELGSMKVTEQIEALQAFAVNPVKYLVVPRFIALITKLPLLAIFADIIGILGGFVVCLLKLNISTPLYFTMVSKALVVKDITTGLSKTVVFGAIIALVGCHQGLSTEGGADGVGKSTTMSVVISFILIVIADCLITTLFYFIFNV